MRNLGFILIASTMFACGSLKRTKDVVVTNTETHTVDEINTVITETIDTTIVIPADSVIIVHPLQDLLDNGYIGFTNGETTVEVFYDSATGNVTAKGKSVFKKVDVQATKVTESNQKTTTKETSSSKSKEVDVEKTGWGFWEWFLFIFIALILIILAIAAYIIRSYLRDMSKN